MIDRVPSGGYVIADNVLWSGKVTKPAEKGDEETEMLQQYNKKVLNDGRVQNVLFPIYRNFRLFSTISIKPTKYVFSYMHEPLRHAMNTIINNTYQCIAVTFFHGNLNAIGLRRYLTYGMGKQNLGIPR